MICNKCGCENNYFSVILDGNGYTILCQKCYRKIFQGKQPIGNVFWCGEFNFKLINISEQQIPKKQKIVYQMFGKRIKDLTKEELKEYKKVIKKRNYKNYYKKKGYDNCFTVKTFGKRKKDLNQEEMREFWRIQQRISRQKRNPYLIYEDNNITKEVLDIIKVNDFVKINTWKRPMKVIAVSENFIIMWRKHFKTFGYSILEKFKRGYSHNLVYGDENCGFSFNDFVCGPDNYYCKFDYSNKQDCEKALTELENGDLEVSTRHGWGVYYIEIKQGEEK